MVVAKAVRSNQTGPGKKSDSTQTGKRDARSNKGAPAKRTSKAGLAKQRAQARSGQKQGFSMARFLRDVRVELSKVTWPTRNELLVSTLVVLVAVAIAGVYTGVLDWVFGHLMTLILPK
jgi:preprotein translocase subunit SecE